MNDPDCEFPEVRNAEVILLDSLNRHMLGAHGGRSSRPPTRSHRETRGLLPSTTTEHEVRSLDLIK
jgi:hypothetical protein